MLQRVTELLILFTLSFFAYTASGAERMGQARLFLGSAQIKPTELNTELSAQGLKNADLNNQFGVEITFPFSDNLNGGLRYAKHLISQDEANGSSATDYHMTLDQDVAALVGRYAFFKTEIIRLDVVLGVGGSNTTYEIKTATQNGSLTKTGSPFATLYSLGGISMAIGHGNYHFILESGYESQKADGFEKTGTINNNVSSIDLSGPYLTIGFMFDGIPISMK